MVSGQHQVSAALTPGKDLGIHWVGPRASLDISEKRRVSCSCCVSVTYKSTWMSRWDDTTRVHNGHHD